MERYWFIDTETGLHFTWINHVKVWKKEGKFCFSPTSILLFDKLETVIKFLSV